MLSIIAICISFQCERVPDPGTGLGIAKLLSVSVVAVPLPSQDVACPTRSSSLGAGVAGSPFRPAQPMFLIFVGSDGDDCKSINIHVWRTTNEA